MALRIRYVPAAQLAMGYSIERLADGLLYDFSTGSFVSNPARPIQPVSFDNPPFAGRIKVTLSPTPITAFPNGDYVVSIHQVNEANQVEAQLGVTMFNGDDATAFPPSSFTLSFPATQVGVTPPANPSPSTP